MADHRPGTVHTNRTEAGQHKRSPSQKADVRSREGPFVSDTTDLMGARVEDTAAAPATDAAPASGAGSRR
ncbi:hypothetical protein, partial [Streptomyces caniscabiei]|uniref:hypothetical protein n=1 Tax=Streptomyces caniscabiei TaxID=2746961 RepID=UPI001F2B8104